MPLGYEASIECPFFIRQRENYIRCESFAKNADCKLVFKSSASKKKHILKVCSVDQGRKCPHYRMMQILYERGVLNGSS